MAQRLRDRAAAATGAASEVLGAIGGLVAVGVMVGFFAAVLHSDATAERLGGIIERIAARVFGLIRRDPPSGITDQLVSFRRSTVDVISRRWAVLTGTNFLQQFAQFGVLMVSHIFNGWIGGALEQFEKFAPVVLAFVVFANGLEIGRAHV